MKKLNLLIHPGFGKTATTWMQESVFPSLKKCIYLGRPSMSQKLHEVQYQLFNPLFSSTQYTARNSEKLINEYKQKEIEFEKNLEFMKGFKDFHMSLLKDGIKTALVTASPKKMFNYINRSFCRTWSS